MNQSYQSEIKLSCSTLNEPQLIMGQIGAKVYKNNGSIELDFDCEKEEEKEREKISSKSIKQNIESVDESNKIKLPNDVQFNQRALKSASNNNSDRKKRSAIYLEQRESVDYNNIDEWNRESDENCCKEFGSICNKISCMEKNINKIDKNNCSAYLEQQQQQQQQQQKQSNVNSTRKSRQLSRIEMSKANLIETNPSDENVSCSKYFVNAAAPATDRREITTKALNLKSRIKLLNERGGGGGVEEGEGEGEERVRGEKCVVVSGNHETTLVVGFNKQTKTRVPVAMLRAAKQNRLPEQQEASERKHYDGPPTMDLACATCEGQIRSDRKQAKLVQANDKARQSDDCLRIKSQEINSMYGSSIVSVELAGRVNLGKQTNHSGSSSLMAKCEALDCVCCNNCALCCPSTKQCSLLVNPPLAQPSLPPNHHHHQARLAPPTPVAGGLASNRDSSLDYYEDELKQERVRVKVKQCNKNVSNNMNSNALVRKEHIVETLKATTRALERELGTNKSVKAASNGCSIELVQEQQQALQQKEKEKQKHKQNQKHKTNTKPNKSCKDTFGGDKSGSYSGATANISYVNGKEEIYKIVCDGKADSNESCLYDVDLALSPDKSKLGRREAEEFLLDPSRQVEFNNQHFSSRFNSIDQAQKSSPSSLFMINSTDDVSSNDGKELNEIYSSRREGRAKFSSKKDSISIQKLAIHTHSESPLARSVDRNNNNIVIQKNTNNIEEEAIDSCVGVDDEKNAYTDNNNIIIIGNKLDKKPLDESRRENFSTTTIAIESEAKNQKVTYSSSGNNLKNRTSLNKEVGDIFIVNKQQQQHLSSSANHLDWLGLTKRYGKMPHRQQKAQFWWRLRQSCLCDTFLSTMYTLFPILTSFSSYSLPSDLITDLVAGFTIAILHIPQGMAYGILAGVEPIHGLYVSFVPVLVMAFMSKSRHVSYGTFAVISMLLAGATDSVKVLIQHQMVASMAAAAAASSSASSATSPPLAASASAPQVVPSENRPLVGSRQAFFESPRPTIGGIVVTNNHKPADSSQQILRNLIPFVGDNNNNEPSEGSFRKEFSPNSLAGSGLNVKHQQTSSVSNLLSSTFALPIGMNYDDFVMPSNIEILTSVCIVVGLIQIIMALMRLGSLSLMFSDQLVSSFTTASAIHVVTSQLGPLFDLNMPPIADGLFKVCRTWWVFGTQLMSDFNQHTAVLTVFSFIFLLSIKEIFEPILRRRYKSLTCLPSELVLMALVIFSSWFWKFNETYDIRIIGNVPTGLPAMKYPMVSLMPLCLQDALTIALVSFAMNLSLGQVYAKKYRYTLNPNQELFALGSSNLIGSFFSCFPCASSLSRSAVQSNLNARSQLCSLFSCAIVVSIICYFAPILHDLPRSTLSCIIIIALRGILVQVTDLYENWRLSKLDAFVWVLTFISVIIFGVTYGLVLGIVASLFMIFFRLLTPNHSILGQLPGTEIYIDKNAFLDCEEINQIKIFRFNSALCYLNRTMFKSSVEKSLPSIYNRQNGFASLFCSSTKSRQYYNHTMDANSDDNKIKFLIIDCSALAYCDYSGAATLVEIIEELEEQKVTVYLAACPLKLISMIEKMQKTRVLEQNVYPTITDAVNHAKYLKNCTSQSLTCLGSNIANYNNQNCLRSILEGGGCGESVS